MAREAVWPGDRPAPPAEERGRETKLRTCVAARLAMLASISDELKAILGSQTTSRGVLSVYETVQWPELNKRLLYVLLEGSIEALLPTQKQIPPLIRSLHSGSSRVAKRLGPHGPRRATRL